LSLTTLFVTKIKQKAKTRKHNLVMQSRKDAKKVSNPRQSRGFTRVAGCRMDFGEYVLAAALVALFFGKFCLGSYLFHLLRGDAAFANRTLPWAGELPNEEKAD
jgi:hypothetical protein